MGRKQGVRNNESEREIGIRYFGRTSEGVRWLEKGRFTIKYFAFSYRCLACLGLWRVALAFGFVYNADDLIHALQS